MKRAALLLLACLTLPAPAIEVEGRVWTLTDAEQAQCRAGGGCVVITVEKLQAAVEAGARQFAGSCGNRI